MRLALLTAAAGLVVFVVSVSLGLLLTLALKPPPKGDPACSDVDEDGNW